MRITVIKVEYQTPANKPFQTSEIENVSIDVGSGYEGLKSKQDIMYRESIGLKEAMSRRLGLEIKDISLLEWKTNELAG